MDPGRWWLEDVSKDLVPSQEPLEDRAEGPALSPPTTAIYPSS